MAAGGQAARAPKGLALQAGRFVLVFVWRSVII